MEGVTDRTFRGLILETCPGAVGATCTEFLRITDLAPKLEKIEEELGEPTPGVELGMQLMGHNTDALADSARVVGQSKADFLDLNFGCPAPRVFRHGAGSALLANPAQLESLTRAVVDASPMTFAEQNFGCYVLWRSTQSPRFVFNDLGEPKVNKF